MLNKIKLLIMVNWKEEGRWDLYQFLLNQVRKIYIQQPREFKSKRLNRLSIRLCEFYLPIVALYKRKSCDAVISWSLRMGVNYGLLNRLVRRRKAVHIIYDFHINPIRSDALYRFRLLWMRLAIPGIDFFLTTSQEEYHRYSTMFAIPPARIRFFPMSPARHYLNDYPFEKKDYILSYGNSDRDYDTLIKSVENINVPMIILTQNYTPAITVPPHVTILTPRREGIHLIELISAARMVVLPLKEESVSAGQTAMLEIMALARPLIVTSNPATREYAVHGKTAIFCQAGNDVQLKAALLLLLENRDFSEELGKRSRQRMMHLVEESQTIFLDILTNILNKYTM